MGKGNGRSDANTGALDLEHELPASTDEGTAPSAAAGAESGPENELQKIKAERDALLDRLARSQAEFENARRRAGKEQQEFREYALTDAMKSLLPVVDSMERALQVKADASDLRNGVELIYKQLQAALARLSVTPITAKGEAFDPRYHEAIEMVETSDAPDHQVIEELQRGYKYKDRLLRPAMVKVAKNPEH
ncbi:MAG TPA: nucleotide exchange factor GrpE [Candidatus Binatia bacterium]|nr:nucleotide exchange factor GrpE [Candidatus Binatia bacterium]